MKKYYKSLPILLTFVSLCLLGFAQLQPMPMSGKSPQALEMWQQASASLDNADIARATELMKKAIATDPDFFMPNYQLAMIYKYTNQPDEFATYLKKAIDSKAELTEGEQLLKDALLRMQENPEAPVYDIADQLIARFPKAKIPYYFKLIHCMMDDKYEEAASLCDQILTFTDTPGSAWNMKGYACLGLNDYDAARDAFDKYIELVPDHPNPYDSKGDYYMHRNQYANAYHSYMKAYQMDNNWSYKKAMKAQKRADWAKGPAELATPDLKGAWLLVKIKRVTAGDVEFEIPGNVTGSQVKIWSDEYFSATGKFEINGKELDNYSCGSYEFEGNHYQETIIYHVSPEIVGSQVNMIMELKGDTLTQTWPTTEKEDIDWDNYDQEIYVKLD
ncbi:lipopolysaccharide assembly protein LapB [Mangrovibacterium marinum]|uniref:Tetratricopeptide repeat protein n=1 Tax=Mangrovibacterium marinum TaxID=1639118 RepID=A0A2T5C2R4_9BACT|nr:tetratricopeptide repeat protein [Mangrovibacterium marinum]PTN09005.1 tetratricopeptide repeat protein [Mangrovibacterium marinum]